MVPLEQKVADSLRKRGYKVLRNGWPDFLVLTDGGLFAVEVKNYADEPSAEQMEIHSALRQYGIPVYVVRPSDVTNMNGLKPAAFVSQAELNDLAKRIRSALGSYAAVGRQLEALQSELQSITESTQLATSVGQLKSQVEGRK